MANTKQSFEENIARLEAVVGALENERSPLAEALSLYEEGMRLVRACNAQLDEAEQRVQAVTAKEDGTVPFVPEAE